MLQWMFFEQYSHEVQPADPGARRKALIGVVAVLALVTALLFAWLGLAFGGAGRR